MLLTIYNDNIKLYNMKRIILVLCLFIHYELYANDTIIDAVGGNYTIIEGKSQKVQMVSEILTIDLYDNYYEMNIKFNFFNHGESTELKVGFPEYSFQSEETVNVMDFKTTVNNEVVEVEKHHNLDIIKFPPPAKINLWYIKNVVFKANDYTKITVHYITSYSGNGPYFAVHYLYGTGSAWKDSIESMTVEVCNHSNYWLRQVLFTTKNLNYNLERRDENLIIIKADDVLPKLQDILIINVSKYPAFYTWPYYWGSGDWRMREEIIPIKELELLNKEQLRILRNSIYAYHGYSFKSIELRDYFRKQEWYKINEKFSADNFSEKEKINLQNIIAEEKRRN